MDIKNIEEKLQEIDNIIKQKYSDLSNIGILSGLGGILLFQFNYSRLTDNEENYDLGIKIIENCIKTINNGYNNPTYCTGISGFGWILSYLEKNNFIIIDNDELLSGLDDYLNSCMISQIKKNNYDFLHGSVGIALYFLIRYKNTKSKELKIKYKSTLLNYLILLQKKSEYVSNGRLRWIWDIDIKQGVKGYNLSLSHGITGIIGFLTKINNEDAFTHLSEKMLTSTINYVLDFKEKNDDALSLFPNWITSKGINNSPSRLSWCYGDLGIGITLLNASKSLKNSNLKKIAISILEHSSRRDTFEKNMVIDAGICHGSFGISQIFHRAYKETENELFKDTARFWVIDGIKKAYHKDGFSGYKTYNGLDNIWVPELSLLEGIAGIGLVLIDYLENLESNWDECLMIS